ncbi:MAG: hypothetical protein AAF298_24840 [Cyanobacteria bacterium P01_A01_bin.40]
MALSNRALKIDNLFIKITPELESNLQHKYQRLRQVCDRIERCQIKLADLAQSSFKSKNCAYLISINLTMTEGFDVYTLRFPKSSQHESIEQAIADIFARTYRKLIELKLEENFGYISQSKFK